MRSMEDAIVITNPIPAPFRIYSYVAVLILGLAVGATAAWWVQGWRMDSKISDLKAQAAGKDAADERATRKQEQEDRTKEQKHGTDSNANEAQYVEDLKKLAGAEARRADDADRRAAELQRLRDGASSREATTRAWAKAESTARGDLANRLVTLEGQLESGVGVVDRGLAVVGQLQGAVERRDTEVAAQQRQIAVERALNSEP